MARQNKPPGKGRIILLWAILVGNILFWTTFSFWYYGRNHPSPPPDHRMSGLGAAIFYLVFGGFFLVAGFAGYGIVLLTHCLTFNFARPVWRDLKGRLYLANIMVPLLAIIGIGFILAAFLSPILTQAGVPDRAAFMGPVLAMVVLTQIVLIWFRVWAPLTPRVITQRLRARGLTLDQMKDGTYLGLSDPAVKGLKRFGAIEEDIGMLWFTPQQLIYWGDVEAWAITHDQLAEVERRADTGSTTMLSGTQHVVLHLRLTDGSIREVRLHTEGIFTLGGHRRAMDELGARIEAWRTGAAT